MKKSKKRLDWEKLTIRLLEEPFALLQDKLDIIIRVCIENDVRDLLEVGTFAGGSTYILGKSLPNTHILSIDINDFYTFFGNEQNNNVRKCIDNYFEHLKFKHLPQIQRFYNNQLTNIDMQSGILRKLDISKYDAIILDGDHTEEGLKRDIKYVLKNNSKCIIFVDDTDHKHIRNQVDKLRSNEKYKNLNVNYEYNNQLAIITRN